MMETSHRQRESSPLTVSHRLLTLERLLALPATDLAGALDDVANLVGEIFGAEKVDAWLHDEPRGQLVVSGYNKTPLSREEVALGLDRVPADDDSRLAEALRTGVPFLIGRADEDPRVQRGFVEQLRIRSMLGAPLEWGGRRRGLLLVSSTRPDAYGADDLDLLQSVARWVGMVAHRAELVEEVAARREAEEERRRLQELFRSAPVLLVLLRGPNHVFTLVNDCFRQLVGDRDVSGKPIREAIPEIVEQGFPALLDRVYATGETFVGAEVPVRLVRALGGPLEEAYLNFAYTPVRGAGGRVEGIFVTGYEVTDLVRARRAAETGEAELRAVLESAESGTLMVGTDLHVRFVNRRFGELFGVDVSNWVGCDKRELLALLKQRVTDPDGFERRLLYLYEHPEQQAVDEVELVAPAGRWFVRHSGPVYAADGSLLGRLESYHDVTASRLAEAERERLLAAERTSRAQAEAALRTRDEFLATISHDLQNPLAGIKGWTQLLQRQVAGGDTTAPRGALDAAAAIERSVGQMSAQVNELLDLTRLQAGEPLRLIKRPTDLVALAREVMETHEQVLQGRPIQFDAAEPSLVGSWDPVRLRRVVANLVTNAVKYSPEGAEVQVSVRREEDPEGLWATVEVRDLGIGIPPADLPHVFERFHRAGNVVGTIAGTGLGLASARHIVELHGGTIRVESEEGRGSTFTVRLPL